MKKLERFAVLYEQEIKEYRDKYYKDIAKSKGNVYAQEYLRYVPYFLAVFLLLIGSFTVYTLLLSLFVLLVSTFLYYFCFSSVPSKEVYLHCLRKHGYFSFSSFERSLKKYLTGEEGLYTICLEEEKKKAHITEVTLCVNSLEGNTYYIWYEAKKNRLGLLQSGTSVRPKIMYIRLSTIRYFRLDKGKNCTILKTDLEDYYFSKDAFFIFKQYIKEKQVENLQQFDPEEYINDYEQFMHTIRNSYYTNKEINKSTIEKTVCTLFLLFICFSILLFSSYIMPEYCGLYRLCSIFFLLLFYFQLPYLYFSYIDGKGMNLDSVYNIKKLNTNAIYLRAFEEMKFALGVPKNACELYTTEKAPYLVWVKNGYIHILLNMVYFNAVYFVVKTRDIIYFRKKGKEVELKLKNKSLYFEKGAEKILGRLLPNKDYAWLQKLEK